MTSTSTMKTFSLSSCDWIGFDLDHTLIRYRLLELHTLIYELMCQYLVDTYQYNSHLLKIPYDNYFGVKALIYDSLYGNLIQLDSNGLVHTALHGVNTRLSSEKIKEIYPHTLEDIEEDTSKRFLCIFTYFDHSLSYLIANIIDLIDENNLYEKSSENEIDLEKKYSFFLAHLNNGFDYLFNDFNRGNYFSSIRENPNKFIYKRLDVRQWLEKLKKLNKKLFLATNSRFDYTDLLTKYAFGDDWKNLFDLIIVDCKKPLFFSNPNKPLFHRFIDENNIIPVTIDEIIKDFNKNYIYSLGNSEDLHLIMSKISDKDPLVIYFGDHIKSDINALKCHTNWLAGVVIEELEFDLPPTIIHTTTHHLSNRLLTNNVNYIKGNRSKYFSSFFTSPSDSIIFDDKNTNKTKLEQTEPDAVLPSLSSYWYTYITKHAHLSLSCLSVLANDFDLDQQFQHDEQTKHFILMHKNE
jgi:HAD superfamily 5'-nucleotidase-like hydrolase